MLLLVMGYKSPPTHSQFRPGHSGNPSGRPKAVRSFFAELHDELNKLVSVKDGGRQIQVTRRRAIARTFVAKAIAGDIKAVAALLPLLEREANEAEPTTSPEEEQLLNDFARRQGQREDDGPGDGGENPPIGGPK